MANKEQEAKAGGAEKAKTEPEVTQAIAKAAQADAEAEQAKSKAEQLKDKAAQAHAEAEQTKAKAEQARTKAAQAKAEAEEAQGKPEQEDKDKASKEAIAKATQVDAEAEQAKSKAEELKDKAAQADAEAEKAKSKAEQLKDKAAQAHAEAEQTKAKAEPAIIKDGITESGIGTSPPGLLFKNGIRQGVEITGKLFPIMFLFIAVYCFILITYNLEKGTLLSQLSRPEVTRGFITFLISFGTIAIAIMLVIAAFISEGDNNKTPLKERFEMGKGVLTALIGILGTIVGFYFGSAPATVPKSFQTGEVSVRNSEPKQGESFDLTFTVKDGEAPYYYSITFPQSSNIKSIKDKRSQDKNMKETIIVPENAPANADITPQIEVTDNNNNKVTFEKIPTIYVNKKPTGEVRDTSLELMQGESYDLTFTVKDGDPPYTYTITYPPETNLQPIKVDNIQDKEIKTKITIPESVRAGTKIIPKIEVTDKNKKPVTIEGKIPEILVKQKTKPTP
jgi:chemotaxis protein histidine kinase CheA